MDDSGQQNDTSSSASSDTAVLVTSVSSKDSNAKGKPKSTCPEICRLILNYTAFAVIVAWVAFAAYGINGIESLYEIEQLNSTIGSLATAKELMIRDLWNLSATSASKEDVFKEVALERIAELQQLLVRACTDHVIADEDDLLNDTTLTRWTPTNTMYFVFTQITTIGNNNNLPLRSGISRSLNALIIILGVPVMFCVLCLIAGSFDISYWQCKRFCITVLAKAFWNKKKPTPQSAEEAPSFISPQTPYIYQNRLNKIYGASPQLVLLILAGYVPFFAVLVQHFASGKLTYAEAVYYSLTTLAMVGPLDSRTRTGHDAEIVVLFIAYTAIGISLLLWFFAALTRYTWQRRMKDAAQQTDEFSSAEVNELEPAVIAQPDNTDQRAANYYSP